ncbi:hypothetical protein WN48_06593 [Eufriesea mexicana]|uniref:Uncharacterized protein n=1 Tax=Eufriesea mexicana TaxID=516756 RepID=A0A310SCE7_9HYME|nr:hypothetical protein WN48_06593 [Eufriesea mexicana]
MAAFSRLAHHRPRRVSSSFGLESRDDRGRRIGIGITELVQSSFARGVKFAR